MGGSSSDTQSQQATTQQQTGNSNTQNSTGPWLPQQNYLSQAFDEANQIYGSGINNPYSGQFTAQPNDAQTSSANNMLGATGQIPGYAGQSAQAGGAAVGQGLGNLNQSSSGLYGIANGNATQNNINAAGQYANNPYLSGQIDAALTDARRNLGEVQLPAIDRDAAGTGNINSSRAGVASGIAERGFQEQAANTAANMRGNAYSQGLNLAQNDTAQRMGALANAGQLGQGALSSGLFGLGNAGNLINSGVNAANAASGQVTANNQAPLTNALQSATYNQNNPFDMLSRYYQIVGSNNWGNQGSSNTNTSMQGSGTSMGSSSTQQNPSALSTIGSLFGLAGSGIGQSILGGLGSAIIPSFG